MSSSSSAPPFVVLWFTGGLVIGLFMKELVQKVLLDARDNVMKKQKNTSKDDLKTTTILYSVQVSLSTQNQVEKFLKWIPGHMQKILATSSDILSAEMMTPSPLTIITKPSANNKPTVIFVLGGPGAGKGTQCQRIVDAYDFAHISAGDCLRAERNSNSTDAALINNYIKEGQIVPVEITVKLLQQAMARSGKSKFLIDGFPRNLNNVDGWYNVVGNQANVAFVLFLDCPEEIMEARLLERGKTSGRIDDNLESIRKRFHTYMRETKPIIDYFSEKGKVRHVRADASVDQVWTRVDAVMSHLMMKATSESPKTSNKSLKKSLSTTTYTMHYRMKNQATLDHYLETHAPRLRQDFPFSLDDGDNDDDNDEPKIDISRSSWRCSELVRM